MASRPDYPVEQLRLDLERLPVGARVTLGPASGESLEGTYRGLEDDHAVVPTSTGERRIGVREITEFLIHIPPCRGRSRT